MRIPGGSSVGIGLGLMPPQNQLTIASNSFGPQSSNLQVTAPPDQSGNTPVTTVAAAKSGGNSPTSANPSVLVVLLTLGAFLWVLKYGSEHEKSGMDPHFMKIGMWSFFTCGLMATLFIVGMKAIVSKIPDNAYTRGFRYIFLAA